MFIIPQGSTVTINGKVYRTLEAQVAWNKEQLESLDIDTLEGLPDAFEELSGSVDDLSGDLVELSGQVTNNTDDISDLQTDVDDLDDRMDDAESDIDQAQFDIGQAQGDITALGTLVNGKLDKPSNTGDTGDVIVKTPTGSEWQAVAPFNPNAEYPGVTAGKAIVAKNLEAVSENSGSLQDEPFFFQATATENNTTATPTAPQFELKALRGNTIVYNQLVDGVSTTYPTISGHVYWFKHEPLVSLVTSTGTDINVPTPQDDLLVDLTRWFNGNIPQAILDDPTIFPINYYDDDLTYSAGELKNCSCTELKTVEKNQFDKSTATDGKIVSSGSEMNYSGMSHSDYIRVQPNTDIYCFKVIPSANNYSVEYFDYNKNYLSQTAIAGTVNVGTQGKVTTPSKCAYVIVNYFTADVDSVCVNFSWDGVYDGQTFPYVEHTYPMVWSGKSAGSAYDEKLPDGTEITRIGSKTFAGTDSWTYTTMSGVNVFILAVSDKSTDSVQDGLCSKYTTIQNGVAFLASDKSIWFEPNTNRILVRDSDYTDASTFASAIAGEEINYWLATPTTSSGDAFTSVIEGDDYGTMSFDSVVPVGNEFFYPADYALLIDDLYNLTNGDVGALMLKSENVVPSAPASDGTYALQVTVSSGTVTYSWEAV